MFGGADLADDLRSTGINSSQDGTATITHAGLTDGNDKLIFFIGTDISGEDSASSGINNSFGVCHISGNDAGGYTFVQRCIGWASDHNNNDGSPSAIISTDRVLDIIDETGGQDWGLEVTAFSSSGGTITVTTRDAGAGAGMEVYSLIVDLDDREAKVGSVDGPTSGATWDPTVSLTFTPQIVSLLLTDLTNEDTITTDAEAGVMGISSNSGGGEETCHSWYNEDAAATINTNNLFRSRAIDLRDHDVSTVLQDHSHSAFDSTGWTYTINTENETVAKKWGFWTIEEATAPSNDQTLTATATGVAVLQLAVAKTLAATAVANAGMSRKCFIPLSETAVGIATLTVNKLAKMVSVAATAVAVVALRLKAKIGLAATATGTLTLRKFITKTLAAAANGIAVLGVISTFRIIVATVATGVATLAKKAKLGLSNTAVGIASVARKARLGLSVSATGIAGFARKVRITLRNTATGVVTVVVNHIEGATLITLAVTAAALAALQITVKKTLGAVSQGVATLDPIATFRALLVTIGTGIAILRTAATFRRAFSATATGLAALAKKPKLGLAATTTGIASVNRTIFKTLRSTAEGVAAIVLVTATFITIATVAVAIPAITLKTKRGLSAVGGGVANIQRFMRKTLRSFAVGVPILNEEVPQPPSRLQRLIIGFFGGPGGGPGR